MRIPCDHLVIGSGVAGLTFAIEASRDADVVLLTKRSIDDAATSWAQGGIAAVLDPQDSFEAHVRDTLATGGGLSRPSIVEMIVREGPDRLRDLVALGARFDTVPRHGTEDETLPPRFDLTREGGHSARRVVHAGDITGREVMRALIETARACPRLR